MAEINTDILNAYVTNHECKADLFGDADPFSRKARKKQKKARECLSAGLTPTDLSCFFDTHREASAKLSSSEKRNEECDTALPVASTSFLSESKKNKNKKKSKKKDKKRKKQSKQALGFLDDNLLEKNPRNANLLSEVYKNTNYVVSKDNIIYVYSDNDGCFHPSDRNKISAEIKAALDEETQSKIGIRDYSEAYDQLVISKELDANEGFFENRPFVNCLNGVLDICSGDLLEHSPDFRFKHCIQAEYVPSSECPKFKEYIDYITAGDKELKKLLRVIMGYVFSHYNNAKLAVLLYGIPHTGKSVLCSLLSKIVGEQYVTNVDLTMLHRQEYAASLSNALLNVAPDLKNHPLKDVGFFKSLVSHDDTIMARTLYSNPTKIKCETKMLFSSNHLISFSLDNIGMYDIEATFNRLLYFPFQNPPIKDENNNKHLSDDLFAERDAIFTWAMGGLRYYIEHNETFPACALSEEIKARNMAQYCPEKIFFSEAVKKADGKYESSSLIKDAFEAYRVEIGAKVKSDIHAYLTEHEHVVKCTSKKRIDSKGNLTGEGNPISVYEGIRLKHKYRPKN